MQNKLHSFRNHKDGRQESRQIIVDILTSSSRVPQWRRTMAQLVSQCGCTAILINVVRFRCKIFPQPERLQIRMARKKKYLLLGEIILSKVKKASEIFLSAFLDMTWIDTKIVAAKFEGERWAFLK